MRVRTFWSGLLYGGILVFNGHSLARDLLGREHAIRAAENGIWHPALTALTAFICFCLVLCTLGKLVELRAQDGDE